MINNFLFFIQVLKIKFGGKKIPATIIFNVTNRCNSQCKHCYASYFNRVSDKEMTTIQIQQVLKDLKNNGCLRVSFSGGEPLLRDDIDQLISYAKSLGMSVALHSNGFLVPKMIDKLKQVDSLSISLDGVPSHHDILRGKGSAVKAMEAIKAGIKSGLQVHVNTVINKNNLDDIDYLIDLAKKTGFKIEFGLAINNIFGMGARSKDVKPSDEEFREAIRKIIRYKKAGAPIIFSAAAYENVLKNWQDYSQEGVFDFQPKGMPTCPGGRFFGLIEPDGAFWACPHLIGKIKSKNVLQSGVAEAWKVAGNHSCKGCYQVYHHEFGQLIDLNPRVFWNYLKQAFN